MAAPLTKLKPQHRLGRVALLLLGMSCLITGIWGGLLRVPVALPLPVDHANWISFHGPLMVCGFLGAVISLERAVGLRSLWTYLGAAVERRRGRRHRDRRAVAVAAVGADRRERIVHCGLSTHPVHSTQSLEYRDGTRRGGVDGRQCALDSRPRNSADRALVADVSAAGDCGRTTGTDALSKAVSDLKTVVVGRLEPAGDRFGARRIFPASRAGLNGLALLAIAAWLLRFDLAWRTIRHPGLPRFMAICLLSGYVWLTLTALLVALKWPQTSGVVYDATLHSFFLGFVFAMIFGHAPVIFPAVLQLPVHYRWTAYRSPRGVACLLAAATAWRPVGLASSASVGCRGQRGGGGFVPAEHGFWLSRAGQTASRPLTGENRNPEDASSDWRSRPIAHSAHMWVDFAVNLRNPARNSALR